MGSQRKILDGARLFLRNVCRTDMLCSTTSARIQKRIFVCEIVKPAFRNDFKDGERKIAKNADRQFPTLNKFLDQKFLIVLRALLESRSDFALQLHDIDADSRTLPRRLDHDGNGN